MKKEEIHQEAVKRRPDLLNSLEWEEGALWMNEKQPYSLKDMISWAVFIGNRPLPEYSISTDKWRWWNNETRKYDYASTDELIKLWKESK